MPMLDVDGWGWPTTTSVVATESPWCSFTAGRRTESLGRQGPLRGRYRFISLDLRGHGDSDRTPTLTIGGLAREVLALLDGLGVDGSSPWGTRWRDDRPHACPGASRRWNACGLDSISRMMYSRRGRRVLILLSRLLPFRMFVAVNIRRAFKPGFHRLRSPATSHKHSPRLVRLSWGASQQCADSTFWIASAS